MASLIIGNIILVILNLPFAGVWAALLRIPFRRLVPLIVVISLIGVHSVQNSLFDVWLMLGFGLFRLGAPAAGAGADAAGSGLHPRARLRGIPAPHAVVLEGGPDGAADRSGQRRSALR